MSRLLISLFALLLPLQFAWSAASAYCQHESTGQAAHFGHHFHSHDSSPVGEKTPVNSLAPDADCAACHAAGTPLIGSDCGIAPFLSIADAVATAIRPTFSSAPAPVPDRPQWLRLV